VGWPELEDLSGHTTRDSLMDALREAFPDDGHKRLLNWQAQLWAFLNTISVGDIAVLPLKTSPAVAIGEFTGPYTYRPDLPPDARHTRSVKWLATDLPRTAFGQDLLYSLGAFLTVCEVKRHEAVHRLESLVQTGRDPGWTGRGTRPVGVSKDADTTPSDEETSSVDIERYAADRISARIAERFAGHRMAYLIQAVFTARGMTTWLSPEGPDGGIDVLEESGPLGMDSPRICVQVKSSSSAVEASIVRELQRVVGRLKADQGLLVAWGRSHPCRWQGDPPAVLPCPGLASRRCAARADRRLRQAPRRHPGRSPAQANLEPRRRRGGGVGSVSARVRRSSVATNRPPVWVLPRWAGVSDAWALLGLGNGSASLEAMRAQIAATGRSTWARTRRSAAFSSAISVSSPATLPWRRRRGLPPTSCRARATTWRSLRRGRISGTFSSHCWACQWRWTLPSRGTGPGPVFGDRRLAPYRLGRQAFKAVVRDAYHGHCAITARTFCLSYSRARAPGHPRR